MNVAADTTARDEGLAPEIAALDLSMFAPGDLANIVLQRSDVLRGHCARPGDVIRAWERGDDAPLAEAVAALGPEIARRAAAMIRQEAADLLAVTGGFGGRIADIGCGYAMFDLFAARATGADLVLIDIETDGARHFGFDDAAAGYADLSVARAFLEANGVAPGRITTLNPRQADPATLAPVDTAVSFLSCGFHFPAATYHGFFRDRVTPGGRIVLDLRRRTAPRQLAGLQALGTTREIGRGTNFVRIELQRSAA